MSATITRLYNSHVEAREVVRNLEAAGIKHADISIVASNADNWYQPNGKSRTYPDRDLDGKDDRAEAAGTGAGVGAAVGTTVGVLTGLGIMAIPGLGPLVAAGWLATALTGLAVGVQPAAFWEPSPKPASAKKRPKCTQRVCDVAGPSSA
jgi:hypothetical protein